MPSDQETAVESIFRWKKHPETMIRELFKTDPDHWQLDVLDAFSSRDKDKMRISLQAAAGPGKGHPVDMLLDTPSGIRRWGDLKPGDLVFAEDGTPTHIKNIYPLGVMKSYKVFFDDGSECICTDEHLWKVRGRTERRHFSMALSGASKIRSEAQGWPETPKDGYSVLTTEQIISRNQFGYGNRRQFEIPSQGAVRFLKAKLPLDPYVLGVWIGDGSKSGGRFTGIDAEIDLQIMQRGYSIGASKDITRTIYNIVPSLKNLGLFGMGSHERFIPETYKISSISQRKDLLRGLMDTDGTIAIDNHCEYSTSSERLAENVVWLVRSLGGVSWIKAARSQKYYLKPDGKKVLCRVSYRVTVTVPFNPFTLERKRARWNKPQARYLKRYIDSIVSVDPQDSMCIEVDHPSHCYLTNDFIVTHNTAVLAWCGWNFLLCYGDLEHHPQGAAMAVTSDNLKDNLWKEFAVWHGRSPLLQAAFSYTKERIFSKSHPETWFISARTWSKSANVDEQGRALSGLHSRYILFLIDESGDINPAILRSAEQGLSNCKWGKIIQAGNPTSLEGMLHVAATSQRHMWFIVRITGDPDSAERSPRISVEWAREQISLYGRDNPWVMSYILGLFPPSSINTLLSVDEVEAAMDRVLKPDSYNWAQKRLGVDVARFGDDRTCLFPRQGLQAFTPSIMRHNPVKDNPSVDIANRVMMEKTDQKTEVELFDDTVGWAHGAIDILRAAGHPAIPVDFGSTRTNNPRYYNRRAEMWMEMALWIRRGGALPRIPELIRELTAATYTFKSGKFILEEKALIKKRLGVSPDLADGLALTFAMPDVPKGTAIRSPREFANAGMEYDPYK